MAAVTAAAGAGAATACKGMAVLLAMGDDPKLMGNDDKGAVGRVLPFNGEGGLSVGLGSGVEPIDC